MTANILNGKEVATHIKAKLADTITTMTHSGQRLPSLAVILVGEDAPSRIYVNNKRKACAEVGITSYAYDLPYGTSEKELLTLITELNHNPTIDGILVQLPLPPTINTSNIIECITPHKDVDGFHPYNLGHLAQKDPILRPCTPYGIMQLLAYYHLPLSGKHAVVVGASNIVGRPMALECLLAGATVTICHRATQQLDCHIRQADVLIVAAGVQHIINPDWLHQAQIVVDVGIHTLENGTLCGDIDFAKAREKVAWITPVPGGVGPMTVATLLQNTVLAGKLQHSV